MREAIQSGSNDYSVLNKGLTFQQVHLLLHPTDTEKEKQRKKYPDKIFPTYRVVNGYKTAKALMDTQINHTERSFDTTFIYKVVDLENGDVENNPVQDISRLVEKEKQTARDIIHNAGGIVVILAKEYEECRKSLEFFTFELVEELKGMRRPGLVVSYLRHILDVIELNEDIARDPALYMQRNWPLIIREKKDYLNRAEEVTLEGAVQTEDMDWSDLL